MMDKRARKSAGAEWTRILKEHPKFARAFLAQQAILMEASELGYRLVDARMCRLLEMGVAVLFQDFWIERCKRPVRIEPGGVLGCVGNAKETSDCFGIKHEDEWFDDPFVGGADLADAATSASAHAVSRWNLLLVTPQLQNRLADMKGHRDVENRESQPLPEAQFAETEIANRPSSLKFVRWPT